MLQKIKKWVLIVDDEPEVLDLYTSYLELHFGENIKIVTATDGVTATNKLPFQAFDLILTDLNMPKKSGQAFIKATKESQMNEMTPIVVISGVEPEDIDPEQVSIHLKPLKQEEFVKIVESQLKLGKTDQRVAAGLLNTFVDSGMKLIDHTAKLEAKLLEPLPKREREGLHGDLFRLVSVKVGKINNQFVFGFEISLLEKMSEKFGEASDEIFNRIVAAAGDSIVKSSVTRLGAHNVSILKQETLTKSSENYQALYKTRGIHIPIDAGEGHLNIYAMWK